jgi:hypothetical protein
MMKNFLELQASWNWQSQRMPQNEARRPENSQEGWGWWGSSGDSKSSGT